MIHVQTHHFLFALFWRCTLVVDQGLARFVPERVSQPAATGFECIQRLRKTIMRSVFFLFFESTLFFSLQCYHHLHCREKKAIDFDTCQHFAQCGLWIVCCFLRLRAGSSLLLRSAGRARPFCELARYASGKGTELSHSRTPRRWISTNLDFDFWHSGKSWKVWTFASRTSPCFRAPLLFRLLFKE